MESLEFSLFRIRITYPTQTSFLHEPEIKRPDILLRAISERPELVLKRTHNWHIGNIRQLDRKHIYFRVGRTTKGTREKFDRSSGNFEEEEQELSPFTHVLLDLELGVMAVSKKPSLAPTTTSIARKIEKLFLATKVVLLNEISVSVKPIPDPVDFIHALKEAFAIKRFSFTFRGPNPVDVDALFHKPLQKLVGATNGELGKTALKGEKLDAEVLVSLTASIAAAGDNAEARIQQKKNSKPVRKSLRKSPALFEVTEEEAADSEKLVAALTVRYSEVRHADDKT